MGITSGPQPKSLIGKMLLALVKVPFLLLAFVLKKVTKPSAGRRNHWGRRIKGFKY